MNIQSIRNKLDEVKCYVKINNCDILVLTETWLNENELHMYTISGYAVTHSCRNSRGGGTSIYIKDCLRFQEIKNIGGNMPYNLIGINLYELKLKLYSVYKPPNCDLTEFLPDFEEIISNEKSKCVIVGDFNLDLLKDSQKIQQYRNSISLFGYKIANKICENSATRTSQTTKTIIDHVLTNKVECSINIKPCSYSDHNQLEITILEKPKIHRPKTVLKIIKLNEISFIENFSIILQNTEIDSFEKLIEVIKKAKGNASETINLRTQEGNDWITYEYINMIKERDKLYKLKKISPDNKTIEKEFNKMKNNVNAKKRKLKKNYFKKKWNETGNNSKKQWKFINTLIKNKDGKKNEKISLEINQEAVSDTKKIVNEFNNYFVKVGKNIVESIEMEGNTNDVNFEEVYCNRSIYLEQTNEKEVLEVLSEMNINSAVGFDEISVKNLISIKQMLLPILVSLINKVFESGEYPDILKVARVVPIHKSGPKNKVENYRPISVISVLSKIIETIIKRRITCFIDKYVKTDKYQYGFQPKSNTLSASIDLINHITTELDKKNHNNNIH